MHAESEKQMLSAPVNLMELDRTAMQGYFAALGEKTFRADQVLKWVYQRGVTRFEEMTNLSKSLRKSLTRTAIVEVPVVGEHKRSSDGTIKWQFVLSDGNQVETVFIPESDRGTLCVSSQAGCALNCSFCATARQGFSRNLSTSEIIGQVWMAKRILQQEDYGERPLTNIVLMGMGEPLLNYQAVVRALRLMLDDFSFGLSRRRVTLSTAGVVPGIDQLRIYCPGSLAVSLHAPDDELRTQLVPLNRKYPIASLLAACSRYIYGDPRRRVTFEYTMLDGINDGLSQAISLARLLQGIPAKVNLIPYNRVEGISFATSPQSRIDAFRDVLLSAGIMCITRKTRGADIDAACGQLVGEVMRRARKPSQTAPVSKSEMN